MRVVLFPLIASCPSCGDDPADRASQGGDHGDLDAVHLADGQVPLLGFRPRRDQQMGSAEHLDRVDEVETMLRQNGAALGFVRLEFPHLFSYVTSAGLMWRSSSPSPQR